MSRILVSYSYVDQPRADQLRSELQTCGYDVSTDADLQPGQGGISPLLQLIDSADAMIVLLSQAALDSQWLLREIEFGLEKRKPIIPVLLEQVRVPQNLANHHFIDATGDSQQALEKIVLALEASTNLRQIPQQAIPRPAAPERQALQRRLGMRLVLLIVLLLLFGIVIVFSLVAPPAQVPTDSENGTLMAQSNATPLPTPSPIALVQVVIALQNIPRGMRIDPSDVGYIYWPEAIAPSSASYELRGVIGRYARTDIFQEQPILDSMLSDSPLNPTVLPSEVTSAAATSLSPTLTVTSTPATRVVLVPDTGTEPVSEGNFVDNPAGNFNATDVAQRVEQTVVAYRATESNELSPAEGAQLIARMASQLPAPAASNDGVWMVLVGVLASVVGMGAMAITTRGTWFLPNRRSASALHRPVTSQETKLPPLLEDFQIFISCSEADKEWIRALVDDMTALGYLVWWYVKDAPGLSFGREIQSAIYHTKVFIVVVSPDSMASKHVEEEIRWAEIYDRPVIPIVYRFVNTRDRLYGLAKRAAIDFSDEKTYKASIEQLTQAVDHYLKQRLAQSQSSGLDTNALPNKD